MTLLAHVAHAAAQPQTTVMLFAAGVAPAMFDYNHLLGGIQIVYFALLIPVAVGHLVNWIGEQYKKIQNRETRIEKKIDSINEKLDK